MKVKSFKGSILFICTIIFILICSTALRYFIILGRYKEAKFSGYESFSMTQHPFYNENRTMEFLIDNPNKAGLKLWWEGLTGSVEVKIVDEKQNICFRKKASHIDEESTISLKPGKYRMDISVKSFTGAAAIGYKNVFKVMELPGTNYSIIAANHSKGFQWEYILYIPDKVTKNNILVAPNDTPIVSDNIDIHLEAAKELAQNNSKIAEELGVPLLVPVFPRPKTYADLYTHALDRETLLTNISELKRLDLQLIAMINDAKDILIKKGIKIDNKILMTGFSASGDFTDRFTFLHPEIVKAAFIGGSNNVIPLKSLNGENLPYPIGVYDYKNITGKEFDIDSFAGVYRYIFKGSRDEGGWITTDESGKVITYTAKEYFQKFEESQLIEKLKKRNSPMYTNGKMTDENAGEISYRAYNGKTFAQRFLAVKSIFKDLNLGKNEFITYDGTAHEITEKIEQDEVNFFNHILKSIK